MKPFVSTREFASVLNDYFPATEAKVRDWCEAGDILPNTAKRDPGKTKKRAHWHIKVQTIHFFLEKTLELLPEEVEEIISRLKAL